MWSNIVIKHDNKSYKDDQMKFASVTIKDHDLHLTEYTGCQGSTTGRGMTFPKAEIVELTPWSIKVKAKYFSYTFKDKVTKYHDIVMTADF
jgi:hypothetical protein